jgi:archaellin
MNKTLLYLQLNNFTVLGLNTNCKSAVIAEGGIFNTLNLSRLNSTNYGIIAIHDADRSITNSNGLSTSDQAMIVVNLTAALSETQGLSAGETLEAKLVPEVGVSGIFVVNAPNAFKYRVCEV